jgi:hypothetical protein
MEQQEIITNWLHCLEQQARSRIYYRLQHAVTQEFEFKGKQWGHPSNYAYVSFRC